MTIHFLYQFLKPYKYAVLATVSQEMEPESAYVGIAITANLKIIFETVTDSRKYQNLVQNSKIAFVIGWDNERTVQYQGTATAIGKPYDNELLETYFEVFPEGRNRLKNWENLVYFEVEPKWIRYSDFNESTRQIEEIVF